MNVIREYLFKAELLEKLRPVLNNIGKRKVNAILRAVDSTSTIKVETTTTTTIIKRIIDECERGDNGKDECK